MPTSLSCVCSSESVFVYVFPSTHLFVFFWKFFFNLWVVSCWCRDQDDLGTSPEGRKKKEKEVKELQRPKMIPGKDEVINWKEKKMCISTRVCKKKKMKRLIGRRGTGKEKKGIRNGFTQKKARETFRCVNRRKRKKNGENECLWRDIKQKKLSRTKRQFFFCEHKKERKKKEKREIYKGKQSTLYHPAPFSVSEYKKLICK